MSANDRTKDLTLEQRVARVLDDAGDMSGPSLVAFVRGRCENDPEVVREVEALFNLAGDENPVLDSPEYAPDRLALDRLHDAIASKADLSDTPTSAFDKGRDLQIPLPQAIGPYRVVGPLGRGAGPLRHRQGKAQELPDQARKRGEEKSAQGGGVCQRPALTHRGQETVSSSRRVFAGHRPGHLPCDGGDEEVRHSGGDLRQ